MRQVILLILFLLSLTACGDSPLYRTPLPNDYEQRSNGGEFGIIVKPSPMADDVIAPLGNGPNGEEQWANRFGWDGDLVVAEVIEYAPRAFVDPPLSQRYLIFDTRSTRVDYFDTQSALIAEWSSRSHRPLPSLRQFHANTQEMP